MAYALRYTMPDDTSPMLVEYTRAELQADRARYKGNPRAARQYPHLERVSGSYAHRWVSQGGIHSTALYLGQDRQGRERILYARDGF